MLLFNYDRRRSTTGQTLERHEKPWKVSGVVDCYHRGQKKSTESWGWLSGETLVEQSCESCNARVAAAKLKALVVTGEGKFGGVVWMEEVIERALATA